jgi:hypothetical protein
MTRRILPLFVVLGLWAGLVPGCGQDEESPGVDAAVAVESFDDEVPPFLKAFCDLAALCAGQSRPMCEADVNTDMAQAKAQLDDAGELRCARCMHIRAIETANIVAANCNHLVADAEAIFAVCDLNPDVDYDGDGNAGNDDDEACLGLP